MKAGQQLLHRQLLQQATTTRADLGKESNESTIESVLIGATQQVVVKLFHCARVQRLVVCREEAGKQTEVATELS